MNYIENSQYAKNEIKNLHSYYINSPIMLKNHECREEVAFFVMGGLFFTIFGF